MSPSRFANGAVHLQSWYPVMRSSRLKAGKALSLELLGRRLAFYRGLDGIPHALEAACPHLGADLGQGAVKGPYLQCFFHAWCFDGTGACRSAPGHKKAPQRRAPAYPVQERDGMLWVFNGPVPLFELPRPSGPGRFRLLGSNKVKAHPHLVAGNGLDSVHLETMHGAQLLGAPTLLKTSPYETAVRIRARLRSRAWSLATGVGAAGLDSTFRTIGGNLAVFSAAAPVPFDVHFASRPLAQGGTETFLLMAYHGPWGLSLLRALALMAFLLPDDEKVLNNLDFRPRFSPADKVLKRLARQVDAMPVH